MRGSKFSTAVLISVSSDVEENLEKFSNKRPSTSHPKSVKEKSLSFSGENNVLQC